MQTLRVKPAPGMKVLDPVHRQFIPDEGMTVPASMYWLRRIRSGEVVEIPEPVVEQDPIPDSRFSDSDTQQTEG